jgi:hypothetical protein
VAEKQKMIATMEFHSIERPQLFKQNSSRLSMASAIKTKSPEGLWTDPPAKASARAGPWVL